jgi:hypothetical protein
VTRLRRAVGRAAAAALLCGALGGGLGGCGGSGQAADRSGGTEPGSGEESAAEHDLSKAADLSTCTADAEAAPTPYGDGFPTDWPFPPGTVVFNAEDRGSDGTIVSAVSSSDFRSILAFMNHDVADAGYTVEKGETEEHDAEAEWTGNDHRGRWAIRESAQCPGETVIQVVAADGS